jgi:hypothetical protein
MPSFIWLQIHFFCKAVWYFVSGYLNTSFLVNYGLKLSIALRFVGFALGLGFFGAGLPPFPLRETAGTVQEMTSFETTALPGLGKRFVTHRKTRCMNGANAYHLGYRAGWRCWRG